MKRLAVLLAVCVMALTGCAQFKAFLSSSSVDYICAGEDVKLTAADMMKAIEVGSAFYAGKVDIEQAVAVLTIIKKSGCFAVAQLKKAFEVVDSINAAQSAKAVRQLKMAKAPLPEYKALRSYIK